MKLKNNIHYYKLDNIELLREDEKFAIFYYEGKPTNYLISTEGRVYNYKTHAFRKPRLNSYGYYDINLSLGSSYKCKTFMIYRMVAETFLEGQDIENGVNTVDHIEGVINGDSIRNLEWVTQRENCRRATDKGWMKKPDSVKGDNNPHSVYTEEQVRKACELNVLGKTNREISKITGIKYNYLSKIFGGKKWNHVTSEYNVKLRSVKIPIEIRTRIKDLVSKGYNNDEIINVIFNEFDYEITRTKLKDYRRNR